MAASSCYDGAWSFTLAAGVASFMLVSADNGMALHPTLPKPASMPLRWRLCAVGMHVTRFCTHTCPTESNGRLSEMQLPHLTPQPECTYVHMCGPWSARRLRYAIAQVVSALSHLEVLALMCLYRTATTSILQEPVGGCPNSSLAHVSPFFA